MALDLAAPSLSNQPWGLVIGKKPTPNPKKLLWFFFFSPVLGDEPPLASEHLCPSTWCLCLALSQALLASLMRHQLGEAEQRAVKEPVLIAVIAPGWRGTGNL